jgi:hypothetical protein
MRLLTLLAGWLLVSLASAQLPPDVLTGTYALETPRGLMVVRIEVADGRLAGTLDVPGSSTIALRGQALGRYARGAIASGADTGEFEALAEGGALILRLSQGSEVVPLRLQRVDPSAATTSPGRGPAPSPAPPPVQSGEGDPRLVGTWVGQTLITSGDASMASQEFLVFRADGTYAYGRGRAVAGGSGWSYEGGGGATEQGRWRTENGIYYVLQRDGRWMRIGKYGFTEDGRTMMITNDRGGKKLWSRGR